MQIKINDASFGFGEDELLRGFSFEVNSGDKIAIIGRNGSGKTTLLKMLTGEIELHQNDNAPVVFSVTGKMVVGSLKQMTFDDESATLENELLKAYEVVTKIEDKLNVLLKKLETDSSDKLVNEYSRLLGEFERQGGYTYHAELSSVLTSFGFSESDRQKKVSEFSGGQKTKIAFIKLILSKPDLLLLDEPTNHLDIRAVTWLENYIKAYKNAVVIVSHDREFLDNTVNIVYEIEHKKLTKYVGNYSKFVETKKQNYETALKMYEAQQREIADIKEFIERFRYKATKASAVQSRVKMLEKMQILPPPEKPESKSFHTKFKPNKESGSEVLSVTNLKIGYSKDKPLSTLNFSLARGERLGIIGGNGLGKSTLLETLAEKLEPISGHFKWGFNTEIGYFKQVASKYYENKSVFECFSEAFPDLLGNEVRNSLGAFLFSGEEVSKPLSSLSGGEIVRFELCKLLQTRPNVLLLDEPTNHMDIRGKETLESLILGYGGTIIFVSHDRYLVNKLATKLLVFEAGKAEIFNGTYREFKDPYSKPTLETTESKIPKEKPEKIEYPIDFDENGEDEYAQMSFYQLSKEKNRLNMKLQKLEEKSARSGERMKQLESDFVNPEIASDFVKLMEIQAEMESLQISESKSADEWLEITSTLEKVESAIAKQTKKNDSDVSHE